MRRKRFALLHLYGAACVCCYFRELLRGSTSRHCCKKKRSIGVNGVVATLSLYGSVRYKKEISSHDLRCACGILKSWDVFISMQRGRAWKKRARRTATASLPLWARIPRVYIWNNELKRAKDAICERPLKTPVLSVCIFLVILAPVSSSAHYLLQLFPLSDFFLLSNECVLKCSEVQYFPQNILK